jgi:hypothetical protein
MLSQPLQQQLLMLLDGTIAAAVRTLQLVAASAGSAFTQ